MAPKRRQSARAATKATYIEDSDDGDQDAQNDSDQDEEANKTSLKRQKTTPVKPRARKAKKAAEEAVAEGADNLPLLGIVINHPGASSSAAKEWVGRYEADRAQAAVEILTLLVQAGGSSYFVTTADVDDGDVDALVKSLIKEVSSNGVTDPFRGKGQKSFRANYLDMWDQILRECQNADVLCDGYLLDKLVHLIIGLNCSVVRSFRFTATLTAQQVVTSLIRAMLSLGEARETAQRQMAAEEKKKASKAGNERVAAFKRTLSTCHRQVQELKNVVASLFQAVSAHRFRDVAPDIRAIVIQGIGSWICLDPTDFIDDQYLKYLAWALSDRDALVRETALDALLEIYSSEDNLSPLHGFTGRFQERFAELVYDVDEAVAVKGVRLVTHLVQAEEMPQDKVGDVYRLLVDSSAPIRHAAAELVAGMLEDAGKRFIAQSPVKGKKGKGAKKSGSADLQLAGVLHIMKLLGAPPSSPEADAGPMASPSSRRKSAAAKSEECPLKPEVVGHIVDALFDSVEVLQDWHAMVEALTDDQAVQARGDAATTNLIMLLAAAVRSATSGAQSGTRTDARKLAGKAKAAAAAASARQDITLALSQALPSLLRKFNTDPTKVAALAGLVCDMKLDIWSLKRQEDSLESLLQLIADLLLKHTQPDALDACLRTLVHCTTHGNDTIQDKAQLILRSSVKELLKRLTAATDAALGMSDADLEYERVHAGPLDGSGGDEEEGEEAFGLRVALLRMHRLQLLSGAASGEAALLKSLDKLLAEAAKGRPLPGPSLVLAAENTLMALMWRLNGLEAEDSASPSASAVASLGKAAAAFGWDLDHVAAAEESVPVQDALTRVQADFFLVFSAEKLKDSPAAAAAYAPDSAGLDAFWERTEALLLRSPPEGDSAAMEDDEEAEDAEAKQSPAAQALTTAKVQALAAAGRLVAFQALSGRDAEGLAACVVMHLGSPDKAVADAVREVTRILKKTNPDTLPEAYLGAMEEAYRRAANAEGTEQVAALQLFGELAQRIGQAHAGFVAGAGASLSHIIRGGIDFALQIGQDRLPFLEGLAALTSRLPAREAAAMAQHLQKTAAPLKPVKTLREWDSYWHMLEELQDRADKSSKADKGTKAALKSAAKSAAKKAASGRKDGRRMSFLERSRRAHKGESIDNEDDAPDEGGEEREPIEDPEEGPQSEAGPSSGVQGLSLRLPMSEGPEDTPGLDGSGWRRKAGGRARLPPPPEDSMEKMDIDDGDSEGGNDQENEAEALNIMPTEEQADFHRPAAASRRQPKRQLKRLYDTQAAAETAEAGNDEDEEDLLEPVFGEGSRSKCAEPPIVRMSGLGPSDDGLHDDGDNDMEDDQLTPDDEPRRPKLRLR